jgi:hypothetical protein
MTRVRKLMKTMMRERRPSATIGFTKQVTGVIFVMLAACPKRDLGAPVWRIGAFELPQAFVDGSASLY